MSGIHGVSSSSQHFIRNIITSHSTHSLSLYLFHSLFFLCYCSWNSMLLERFKWYECAETKEIKVEKWYFQNLTRMISNDPVFFCNKRFWMNRLFFENHIWVLIPNFSFSNVDSFARMLFLIEWKKKNKTHPFRSRFIPDHWDILSLSLLRHTHSISSQQLIEKWHILKSKYKPKIRFLLQDPLFKNECENEYKKRNVQKLLSERLEFGRKYRNFAFWTNPNAKKLHESTKHEIEKGKELETYLSMCCSVRSISHKLNRNAAIPMSSKTNFWGSVDSSHSSTHRLIQCTSALNNFVLTTSLKTKKAFNGEVKIKQFELHVFFFESSVMTSEVI